MAYKSCKAHPFFLSIPLSLCLSPYVYTYKYIHNLVAYLMPNPVYTYKHIYDLYANILLIVLFLSELFSLVSLFNGISIFLSYLMPIFRIRRSAVKLFNPYLGEIKGFMPFPMGISPKVNIIS